MDIVGKKKILTKKDVKHVAGLANLKLTADEVEKFSGQLSEVLNYIEELKKVDTSDVEPTSQTTGLENITRKDDRQPQRDLTQSSALSGTEETYNGYFSVPGILEKNDQ